MCLMKQNEKMKEIVSMLNEKGLYGNVEISEMLGNEYVFSINIWNEDDITYESASEDDIPLTDDKMIDDLYNYVRVWCNKVCLGELSENQIVQLCKRIGWGSIYYADFNNNFGVDCHVVSNYADGFIDYVEESQDFGEWLKNHPVETVGKEFYNYIQNN